MSGRLHLTPAFFSDVHLSLVKLEICCYFVLSLQGWDVSFSLLHGLFRQILKKPKQAHTGPRPRTSHPEKRESSGHVTANLSHLVDMSEFKCWTHCNWWVFMLSLWRKYGNRQFLCAEIRPHLYNKVRTWTPSWRSIGNVLKGFAIVWKSWLPSLLSFVDIMQPLCHSVWWISICFFFCCTCFKSRVVHCSRSV